MDTEALDDFKRAYLKEVEPIAEHNRCVHEAQKRKPLNRDACYKTGLQVLAAGTRKYKAAKKHIDKLGNEEFNKELNRLIYEQEKFHKEVARALRQEQRK